MSVRSLVGTLARWGTIACALAWIDHNRPMIEGEIGRTPNPVDALDRQSTVTIAVHSPSGKQDEEADR